MCAAYRQSLVLCFPPCTDRHHCCDPHLSISGRLLRAQHPSVDQLDQVCFWGVKTTPLYCCVADARSECVGWLLAAHNTTTCKNLVCLQVPKLPVLGQQPAAQVTVQVSRTSVCGLVEGTAGLLFPSCFDVGAEGSYQRPQSGTTTNTSSSLTLTPLAILPHTLALAHTNTQWCDLLPVWRRHRQLHPRVL